MLDRKWREHLYEMDYLREGIGLRAYAQRDPLVEYQREGFDMFTAMMDGIKEESVGFLFNLEVQVEEDERGRGRRGGRGRSRCGASCPPRPARPPGPTAPHIRRQGPRPARARRSSLTYSAPRGRASARPPRAWTAAEVEHRR